MGVLPVIGSVAVIRVYGPWPRTGAVPATDTFEPVAKSILPPVIQVLLLPKATSTVPRFCTSRLLIVPRVVVDPFVSPRTKPFVLTCTTPAAPPRFKLAKVAVETMPFTIVFEQATSDPPAGIRKVPPLTVVVPL